MKAQMIQKADVIYPSSSLFLQPHYLSLSLPLSLSVTLSHYNYFRP